MLIRLIYRCLSEVSWRLLCKAAYLWCGKTYFALRAFKKRQKAGVQFPPFLFLSLTNQCNLRCAGCWVANEPAALPKTRAANILNITDAENVIDIARQHSVNFVTLLGGEPFLYPHFWELIERYPRSYFQVITNGHYLDAENVKRLKRAGNVSPLVSIDGLESLNDQRRGEGAFRQAAAGCRELQKQHILYGVATVVTGSNFEEVLTENYAQQIIDQGAMYLWYYIFRPVGTDPHTHWVLSPDSVIEMRRRILKMRRTMPMILIDTYWDADGYAVCPAAKGMAFVVGPTGSIEPCPPLNVCREFITDNGGDFYKTVNESAFLRNFRQKIEAAFAGTKSQGCMILDAPSELAKFFSEEKVTDVSGRDIISELSAAAQRNSHYLAGNEIPEDYWIYRLLKKQLFFGMGGYG